MTITTPIPITAWQQPCVYRLFDTKGRLLYVGQSINAGSRISSHFSQQPWGRRIANVSIEECRDVAHAREREAEIILAEQPYYNRNGKGTGPTPVETKRQHLTEERQDVQINISQLESRRRDAEHTITEMHSLIKDYDRLLVHRERDLQRIDHELGELP